jgi:O-antigen/teichoic acid export membrane protein
MRQSYLILSNALAIWIGRVFLLFPQLIMVPFLIHTIGDDGYGTYVLIWSLIMAIDQLEKSLQSGVVKYSAAFLAKGRMDQVNKVVSSTFVYSILLGVVACIGILTAAAFGSIRSADLLIPLAVIGVLVLITIPLTPYVAVIQSQQRYYVGVIAETLAKYASLLAVVAWFDLVGPSVEALIVIMAGTLFLSRLVQVPVAYRLVSGLRNHPHLFDWQTFRLIASFGAVTVLASLCIVVNTTGIRWLMGVLVSASFVAHLAIILMPGALLSQVIQAITITVMPATSAYEATGNHLALQELLIRGTRYTTILLIASLIAACLLMRDALVAWIGPDYEFLSPHALVLFSSSAFLLSTSTAHHMLKGLGKLRAVVFTYLVGLAAVPTVLILAVFVIWKSPYVAVCTGLAVGNTICGLLQMRFAMKAVHADLSDVFMRAYGQPLIAAVAVCPLAISLITYWEVEGILGCLCAGILTVTLFFTALYALFATPAERRQAWGVSSLAWNRIAGIRGVLPRQQRRSNADAS